jgi:hypothetical protein
MLARWSVRVADNSGLESKKMRSIQFKKQDSLPKQALEKMLLRAVEIHGK